MLWSVSEHSVHAANRRGVRSQHGPIPGLFGPKLFVPVAIVASVLQTLSGVLIEAAGLEQAKVHTTASAWQSG